MEITLEHNRRMAKMTFATVYPLYLTKVEKKGRTKEELLQVVKWLTGFDDTKLKELIDEQATFETFFKNAKLNSNADLIKGVICGYRIEEIENPLTKQVRYSRMIRFLKIEPIDSIDNQCLVRPFRSKPRS